MNKCLACLHTWEDPHGEMNTCPSCDDYQYSKLVTFDIKYADPETGDMVERQESFQATKGATAEEWASDYAYMLAGKGWCSCHLVDDNF